MTVIIMIPKLKPLQRTMFLLGRSNLLFTFLLLLPLLHNAGGMDGCQRDRRQDREPEDAWSGQFYWRCGDICTSAYTGHSQNCTLGVPKYTNVCYTILTAFGSSRVLHVAQLMSYVKHLNLQIFDNFCHTFATWENSQIIL